MTMNRVRGIFEGVDNPHGFDFREFDIVDGKPKNFKWIAIMEASQLASEIPRFKSKNSCGSKEEWHKQFEDFVINGYSCSQ